MINTRDFNYYAMLGLTKNEEWRALEAQDNVTERILNVAIATFPNHGDQDFTIGTLNEIMDNSGELLLHLQSFFGTEDRVQEVVSHIVENIKDTTALDEGASDKMKAFADRLSKVPDTEIPFKRTLALYIAGTALEAKKWANTDPALEQAAAENIARALRRQ